MPSVLGMLGQCQAPATKQKDTGARWQPRGLGVGPGTLEIKVSKKSENTIKPERKSLGAGSKTSFLLFTHCATSVSYLIAAPWCPGL